MSHFVVFVISPEKPEKPQEYVDELLAPFDENLLVDSYLRDCWCVGGEAREEVNEQVAQELGKVADIRDQYWKEINALVQEKVGEVSYTRANSDRWLEARSEACDEISPSWEERIQPILDREEELLNAHPKKTSPATTCEKCGGTGKYKSSYNPKSKWDWYQIGGRWTGMLDPDYDPAKDPRNQAPCELCNGTGMRTDKVGQDIRAKDPTFTCNGCKEGVKTRWPSLWVEPPEGSNIAPVKTVLKHIDNGHNLLPFAIVRPTGEWLEKGEMGWWAMISNEKANWKDAARSVLEEYVDSWVIVVDCHI